MEEVRGAEGPWTVAGDDPQEGGEKGVLVVKRGWGGVYKWKPMERRQM